MFRQVVVLGFLALIISAYAEVQVTYSIGGSDVIFVFSRVDDITTVTWTDFAATADSNGNIDAGSGTIPAGYMPGPTYQYSPEGLVRCVGSASGLSFFQLIKTSPAIKAYPMSGNDANWTADQSVVFRAGSVTYSNL
jgi:hypothetical protein